MGETRRQIVESIQPSMKSIISPYAIIEDGAVVEDGAKVEHGAVIYSGCRIKRGAVIAANVVLRPKTIVGRYSLIGIGTSSDGYCSIGDYTTVHDLCLIAKHMKIGNNVFIGPGTFITNTKEITRGRHGIKSTPSEYLVTIIEDDVRVGATCKIAPGVVIGKGSMIDMNTFIVKDIEPYSHVRGGKDGIGKVIGKVSKR